MLTPFRTLLDERRAAQAAAAAFTCYDVTTALGVVLAAEERDAPLILLVSEASFRAPRSDLLVAALTAVDQADPAPGDERDSVTVRVPSADLSVALAVDRTEPNDGDTLTYRVTLRNGGPDGASGIVVTDLIPAALGFRASASSQGTYAPASGRWSVGRIAPAWARGLVVGSTAAPWRPPAREGGAFRGRGGEGVRWRPGGALEIFGGRFAGRDLAGLRGSFAGAGAGVVAGRAGAPQASFGLERGALSSELALDRAGRWRAESGLERELAPFRLAARVRGGHPAFVQHHLRLPGGRESRTARDHPAHHGYLPPLSRGRVALRRLWCHDQRK